MAAAVSMTAERMRAAWDLETVWRRSEAAAGLARVSGNALPEACRVGVRMLFRAVGYDSAL
jgi:hypothetical protein